MDFKFIEGNKAEKDKILLVKTTDWEQLKIEDLLYILRKLSENEKRIMQDHKYKNFFFKRACVMAIDGIPLEIIKQKCFLK